MRSPQGIDANQAMVPNDVDIDVLMLVRSGRSPRAEVVQALQQQIGVRVRLFVHVGIALESDCNRWETIARARNQAKSKGRAGLVMFVDDDVILDAHCLQNLMGALNDDPQLGAIAADYAHDQHLPGRSGHIGMGATLFRRQVLNALTFRSTDKWCECWCACLDLRRSGIGIRYSSNARATHLRRQTASTAPDGSSARPPRILAAFDRRDIARFESQFLKSLRASGNREEVTAVAYGLFPSERARLATLPGVRWDFQNYNGVMAPIRRLSDFARHLASENPRTPVAYWDVADVVFQDSLAELWHVVRSTPHKIRAVIEPKSYPHNKVVAPWCLSIHHPVHRIQAFELLRSRPFLNSGFAAGTAGAMLAYFTNATAMRHGPQLSGSTDWGDQMCLNLYCHQHPDLWCRIDQRWNYCVHDRAAGEVFISHSGMIQSRTGQRISAAHGNARSLRQFAILVNR